MLQLRNLDERTRGHMLLEFEADLAADGLYFSKRFTVRGRDDYPDLMQAAIAAGDDGVLAAALNELDRIATVELRQGKEVAVPYTAAATFAEGEFNRFYARGVCLRAFEDGTNDVVAYRAKAVANPRSQSEALLGTRFPASTLLDDLRVNTGVDTALGLPPGPNSGLSVYCGCGAC